MAGRWWKTGSIAAVGLMTMGLALGLRGGRPAGAAPLRVKESSHKHTKHIIFPHTDPPKARSVLVSIEGDDLSDKTTIETALIRKNVVSEVAGKKVVTGAIVGNWDPVNTPKPHYDAKAKKLTFVLKTKPLRNWDDRYRHGTGLVLVVTTDDAGNKTTTNADPPLVVEPVDYDPPCP